MELAWLDHGVIVGVNTKTAEDLLLIVTPSAVNPFKGLCLYIWLASSADTLCAHCYVNAPDDLGARFIEECSIAILVLQAHAIGQ